MEKSGVEQRLCYQQRQNTQGADGEKFIDVTQGQKKSDRQREQEGPAKSGKLTHFHGGDEPEAPDQANRQQDDASAARSWKSGQHAARRSFHCESDCTEQAKDCTGNERGHLQREMINHRINRSVVRKG